MSSQQKNGKVEEEYFYCINCMKPSLSLYIKYSQEVIRITECVGFFTI